MTYLTPDRDALAKALCPKTCPPDYEHPYTCEHLADALIASGAVIDAATLADDEALVESARKAIEDELIEWRDARRFMTCGNGFAVREKDGSDSPIIRFRTDVGFRIGLRALAAAVAERAAR